MEKSAIEKQLLSSSNNLFITDLKCFSADFREKRQTHCYFIAQGVKEREEISDLARILLDKGCRDFHFCGSYEPLWHLEFDSVYVDSFQNEDKERIALTSGYETIDEFAEELLSNINYWCIDEDHYLIYDDQEEYGKLLEYLKGEVMSRTNIPCPVCGKYIFNEEDDYDICKHCGWENENCFEGGGANDLCIDEYKKRYQAYVELNPKYIWKTCGYPDLSVKDMCRLAHRHAASNHEAIIESTSCGCFFCKEIFAKELVTEWIADKNGKTAVCPLCGVDSVLPDRKVQLSKEFLEEMHKVWFKE